MCSLKIRRCLVVSLSMLCPLFCAAQEGINGEAAYISFSVPGALGTYPMSVNNSMTVTGYYYTSSTTTGGFVRGADGAITTFSVRDGVWTEPESINDAGEITGFYQVVAGLAAVPQGFIRYADGQIITFNPPCSGFGLCNASQPVSINAFGEVAGTYPYLWGGAPAAFTRSKQGVFSSFYAGRGGAYGDVLSGLNGTGTIVGFGTLTGGDVYSFIASASPYGSSADYAPVNVGGVASDGYDGYEAIIPEGINANGIVAGWYTGCVTPCPARLAGAFVQSPDGVTTLFNPPGTLVTFPRSGIALGADPGFFQDAASLTAPHRLSINQPGSITGSYVDTAGAQHGFVRNPYGTITSFDPPRGRQTTPTSINDSGVIVGSYFYDWNPQIAQGFLRFIPKP